MAEKILLDVNLDCRKCYKKVRKTLCKFNEIQSWSFDEKQKKVIISGPFNPECLIKKLYCKVGCKIIKGHEIIKPKPPAQPKSKAPEVAPDKATQEPPKAPSKPTKIDPPPPAPPIVTGPIYVGPICCRRGCYDGRSWDGYCRRGGGRYYYDTCCEDCREGRPRDGPCTKGGYDGGCHFFSEEDFSCRTM